MKYKETPMPGNIVVRYYLQQRNALQSLPNLILA